MATNAPTQTIDITAAATARTDASTIENMPEEWSKGCGVEVCVIVVVIVVVVVVEIKIVVAVPG